MKRMLFSFCSSSVLGALAFAPQAEGALTLSNVTYEISSEATTTVADVSTYDSTLTGTAFVISHSLFGAFTTYTGAITIDVSNIEVPDSTDYTILYFNGAQIEDLEVTLKSGDYTYVMPNVFSGSDGVYIATAELSAITVSSASESVPEPATATLGLLALAGLAARRRRK